MSIVDLCSNKYEEDDLTDSGTLSVMFCWGNTANGELGLGGIEEEHILSPRELKFTHSTSIRTIACGKTHTLVVTSGGEVYSCGSNDFGELGHNNARTKLHLVNGLSAYKVKYAACGENHSMALNEWGQVFTWGSDKYGQLGLDSDGEVRTPKIVKALATHNVIQIASGYRHCLALTNKGDLFAWGSNEHGQLGLGLKVKSVPQPSLVTSLNGLPISLIACGAYHSFVISKSGAVYGWGKNRFGQLGLNSEVDHIYPCQLKTLRSIKVKYIVCGEDFSVFLSQDGGVLTCGAGQYGQLGHGSISNEVLPRKVLELMGSTVTQVCCGRRHTLAFIPSRERVYSFGLGGAGQLGTKQLVNYNSPQVVVGPWLGNDGNSSRPTIDRLYSGGDHCFVTLLPTKKGKRNAADYRVLPQDSQIWTVTLEKMKECEKLHEDSRVDQDLLSYLESVLSSQCCINGSFLLKKDMHYCCTSRHHGLDMTSVQQCFTAISRLRNETVKNVIYDSVVSLLPLLSESPPDVETLRLYVSLPLYHEFNNARHSSKIQGPFAQALLRLKTEAAKIVGNWYYMQSEDYFERLVQIYKNVILVLLRSSPFMNMQNQFDLNKCEKTVIDSLEVLSRLNKLNRMKTYSPKVGYDTFHMTELCDTVDIRVDYVRWASENPNSRTNLKFFCNYPFLFDAQAKTLLLQTDQSMQMHNAVNEATQRAITQMLFAPVMFPVQPLLELHVSRENIIQDTIRELASYSERDYKKPLKIHFLGEEAEDAGGVKKEFFLLLLREVLDPKYGMFISDPETNCIWFSEDSFEDEIMYYLVGLLCGLAIYNFTIINLPFPVALYKKLLHEPVDLQDLKDLSPSLAKGLQDLLEYSEEDVEAIFCMKFEISRDVYGEVKTHELKPGGSNIPVNNDNRQEYVDLYVDHILNKGVARHFRAFHDGFHKVCGGRVLQLFHATELMAVVIGNENYDWDAFENNAEYRGGYTSSDPTIRMFWEVFHELSLDDKKKFLTFLTGTDRIPIQGMKAIKIIIQPTLDEKYLPVAHTCFNLLDLPKYSTKSRLKYKLLQAIQQTQGFSLV
ncbi:HECT and RLD domain containing E3 ubiquitin ligase 4 isoform X2 [Rhodnius prolixus]